METLRIWVVLFDGFEPLDVCGPAEVLGYLGDVENAPVSTDLHYVSRHGGIVHGAYGVAVSTELLRANEACDVLLIPGGMGTRLLIGDTAFIDLLRSAALSATDVLTVCTGSAVLAATGLLDGKKATSNKRAFAWVRSVRPQVRWQGNARWVEDDHFVTSSGVSAGIDMALGFVATRYGRDVARSIAHDTEYVWNPDSKADPFAIHATRPAAQ